MALITIPAFTVQPTTGITGTSCVLRLWYSQGFLDSTNQFVNSGTATTGFQKRVTCVISGGVIVVPQFTIWSTIDANVPYPQSIQVGSAFFKGNSQTSATIFNQNGTPSMWVIPSSFGSTMTYAQWTTYNEASVLANPPQNYYTADEVNRLLAGFSPSGGGEGFYFLTNYADLATAILLVGDARATLLIDTIADVDDDLTVPENITLFFTSDGGIRPADSQTVTIVNIPQANPTQQIFFNALFGEGTITLSSGGGELPVYPRWWGLVGTFESEQATGAAAATALAVEDSTGFKAGQRVLVRGGGASASMNPSNNNWTATDGTVSVVNNPLGANSVSITATSLYTGGDELAKVPVVLNLTTYKELRFRISYTATVSTGDDYIRQYALQFSMKNAGNVELSSSLVPFYTNSTNEGFAVEFRATAFDKSVDLSAVRFVAVTMLFMIDTGQIVDTGVGFTITLSQLTVTSDLATGVNAVPDGTTLDITNALVTAVAPDTLPQPQTGLNGVLHDDIYPLFACVSAVPNYSTINIAACDIPLSQTLEIFQRTGLRFEGGGNQLSNARLGWVGDGGGTMFYVNRSQYIYARAIRWLTDILLPANIGTKLDMGLTGSQIQTGATFEYCSWENTGANFSLRLVDISSISHDNCEFNRWRYCGFQGQVFRPSIDMTSVGARIGPSFNAKSEIFEYCAFENLGEAIYMPLGSFVARHCTGTFCNFAFHIGNATEPIVIDGANFEETRIVLFSEATDAPVALINGRFTGNADPPSTGTGLFQLGNGSNTQIEHCTADGGSVGTDLFQVLSGDAILSSRGSKWDFDYTQANFRTFRRVVSYNDEFRLGNLPLPTSMVIVGAAPDTASIGGSITGFSTAGVQKQWIGQGSDGRSGDAYDRLRVDYNGMGTLYGGYIEMDGYVAVKQRVVVGDITITPAVGQSEVYIVDATGGNIDITLPAAVYWQALYRSAPVYKLVRIDGTGNTVRLNIPSGGTLNGSGSPVTVLSAQYKYLQITANTTSGTNYYILASN